jgi:membrane fusion protein (multidrug efflux system)
MQTMLLIVGAMILALGSYKYLQIKTAMEQGAHRGPPPQGVTTAKVTMIDLKSSIQVVGTLSPSQGVTLGAEEEGKVISINFASGQVVKAGDVLVELDTSVESAQLQSAEAKLELARINLKRVQSLFKQSAISEQALNNAVSEERAADGEVKAIKGIIARKKVVAPFDGRAGIRLVNVGQYLTRGAAVVPLQSLGAMLLDFNVPERFLPQVDLGHEVEFRVDVYPDVVFTGGVTAIDPQINRDTRNFKVQAVINNKEEKLRPGMFARVTVLSGEIRKVLAVPGSSINYAPYGNSVFIAERSATPDGEAVVAKQQFVTLGSAVGDLIEVTKGLAEGQEIVSSGTFKLQAGIPLIVNNKVTPSAETVSQVDNT